MKDLRFVVHDWCVHKRSATDAVEISVAPAFMPGKTTEKPLDAVRGSRH
jgi:hypothetical protein